MTLKNAFDGLATESTLKRLMSLLNFARDPQDRMRVVVDSALVSGTGNVGRVSANLGTEGTVPVWYNANGSPWSIDPRDEMRAMTKTINQQTRNQKWTYT